VALRLASNTWRPEPLQAFKPLDGAFPTGSALRALRRDHAPAWPAGPAENPRAGCALRDPGAGPAPSRPGSLSAARRGPTTPGTQCGQRRVPLGPQPGARAALPDRWRSGRSRREKVFKDVRGIQAPTKKTASKSCVTLPKLDVERTPPVGHSPPAPALDESMLDPATESFAPSRGQPRALTPRITAGPPRCARTRR
jgi:hypothetical protein